MQSACYKVSNPECLHFKQHKMRMKVKITFLQFFALFCLILWMFAMWSKLPVQFQRPAQEEESSPSLESVVGFLLVALPD